MAAPIQIVDLVTNSAARITMRWKEPYVTEGINKKLAVVLPHGVYRGWRLGTSLVNMTITVVADPENNDHVLTTRGSAGEALTVRLAGGALSLPLTAPAFASQTVVLGVYANYTVTAETAAEIRGYLLADWDTLDAASKEEVVVLGTVVVPGSGPIAASSVTHERRSESWAKVASATVPWAPLVKNSSFEWGPPAALGLNRWPPWENTVVTNGNWTVDTVDPELSSGKQHLQLSSTLGAAALTGSVFQKLDVPLNTAEYVRLIFKVKAVQAATGGTLTATVRFRNTTGAAFDSVQTVTLAVPDVNYRTFDKIIPIPSGATQVGEVRLDASSLTFAVATAAVRIDNLQLFMETRDVLSAHPEYSGKGTVVASSVVLTDPTSGATSNSVRISVDPTGGTTGAGEVIVGRPDGNLLAAQPTLLVPGPVVSTGGVTFTGGGTITGAGHIDLTAEGATSITALHGVGGAPDGIGVWGDGTGTGQGVYGKGNAGTATVPPKAHQGVLGVGGVGGHGVQGVGEGVGAGVLGTSGATINSAGGDFTSQAGTTGPGVKALGSGTGPGVKGTGGASTNSFGGDFTSSAVNGNGVQAIGVGTGFGVTATGGSLASGSAVVAGATSPTGYGVIANLNNTAAGGSAIAATSNSQGNAILAAQIATTGAPGFAIKGVGFLGGVNGESYFAPGVFGEAKNALALAGVWGKGLGTSNGVRGEGTSTSTGVVGTGGISGVLGQGTGGGIGVKGESSNTGVVGSGIGSGSYGGIFQAGISGSVLGSGVVGKGALGGNGVEGIGDQLGTGIGVRGVGGLGGGAGVSGYGTDDFAGNFVGWSGGIVAESQSGAAAGVTGFSSSGNGRGVMGTAHNTGEGGRFESPAGLALHAIGGTGTVTGSGVLGEAVNGTDVNSYGVKGTAYAGMAGVWGVSFDVGCPGGKFESPGYGIIASGVIGLRVDGSGGIAVRTGGYVDFTAPGGFGVPTVPVFTDASANRLTAKNFVKAWAQCVWDTQTPAACRIIDGFNVSSVTRTGTTYFLNYAAAIGRPNISGTGTNFSLSGIVMTFTSTGGFHPADVGRSIVIAGATSGVANNGTFIITAYISGTQIQYLNAPGVSEAFPGTWSITETPYFVGLTLSDGGLLTVKFNETRDSRVGFVVRNSAGSATTLPADLGDKRILIEVTGPQY